MALKVSEINLLLFFKFGQIIIIFFIVYGNWEKLSPNSWHNTLLTMHSHFVIKHVEKIFQTYKGVG